MTMQGFGSRLLKARENLGLTIEEVSAKIKVSVKSLCAYESEQRVPRDEVAVRLADLYQLPLMVLFYGA